MRVYIQICLIFPINIFYNYAGLIGLMYKLDKTLIADNFV